MKLNKDKMQIKLNDLKLDFEIIEYHGYTKKNKIKHSCGFEFEMRLDHVINRKRCPNCDGRKRNIEKFQEESNKRHNNEYKILEFENGNKPVKMIHNICGFEFSQVGFRHLRGNRCPNCYRNNKYSKDDIINMSNKKYNGEYKLMSDNIHYDKKCLIRHKCGYEYNQRIYAHLLGSGCPKCAGNAPHTIESVQEKSDKIHNKEYKILTNPNGITSRIKILHLNCGKEFLQVVGDHLQGCGCSNCNLSKGEKFIENFLIERNIKFEKQKTFDGCKFKNKLKFDFFTENNICIEYDGHHHFYPIRYFGGKKAFESQKIKDNIKTKYCTDNDIKLVRIKYDDNIVEKLQSVINI